MIITFFTTVLVPFMCLVSVFGLFLVFPFCYAFLYSGAFAVVSTIETFIEVFLLMGWIFEKTLSDSWQYASGLVKFLVVIAAVAVIALLLKFGLIQNLTLLIYHWFKYIQAKWFLGLWGDLLP